MHLVKSSLAQDGQKPGSDMPVYLKNVTYIDWKTLQFSECHLKVPEDNEGVIEFVDEYPEAAYDGSGKIVTKSFACAHHHAYSALARGMPPPVNQAQNFKQVLEYIWWHLDKQLDREMIRASALVTALACAQNGVSFVVDHHASPYAIPGSLEIIADAFDEAGINHLLCYEMSDRDGTDCRQQGLRETENYLKRRQGLVGLHASFTVEDELLHAAVHLAEKFDSGIHIHVAEDQVDQEASMRKHKCRVIERLDRAGVLALNKSLLAHCIHLDDKERQLLSDSNAWIAVNTESNLNNQVGLFSNRGGLENKVLLGTDGMHSDMLRNAQINYFTHKAADGITLHDSYMRLRRIHHYLHANDLAGDGNNNLVVFDYQSPTPVRSENFLGHLFYGMTAKDICGLICNGRWVMRDRRFTTVDPEMINSYAREQAERLWEKLK